MEKESHTVFLGELGVYEPSEHWWEIKKVADDRPTRWPRRVRKPSPPPIIIESAASDEEREKNRHVDKRKHNCDRGQRKTENCSLAARITRNIDIVLTSWQSAGPITREAGDVTATKAGFTAQAAINGKCRRSCNCNHTKPFQK